MSLYNENKGKGVFEQSKNNKTNRIIERGNLIIFDKDGEESIYPRCCKIQNST